MEAEQLLQDRLERLETGEALENILEGLPNEESDLLFLAAQIIAIPKPERNSVLVREQRQRVMQATKQNRRTSPFSLSLKWLLPVGMALFLLVMVAGAFGGMNWFLNQGKNPTPDSVASSNGGIDNVSGTTSVPSLTPDSGQFPTPNTGTGSQLASLQKLHGIVQLQQDDGSWAVIQTAEIQAGQTVQTGPLSSAQLFFGDGTVLSLGANTQLTVETINAPAEGPRQISLFQASGSTSHYVMPSSEQASAYVVHTPSARGEAKGTAFEVTVSADDSSSFAVIDGVVAVTGQETAVDLNPGQITFVERNATPSEPVFWIDNQGEVTQTGETWIIGGVVFQTFEGTKVIGAPQVGDWVAVRGHLLADGTRLADRIEKQAPALTDQFRIFGIVDTMGVLSWTISGQEILVNEGTQIDPDTELGSRVLVRGTVQTGGTLLAMHIQLLEETTRFEFTGLLEQMDGESWTISGISVTLNAQTEIDGDPAVGDMVHVEGGVLSDGTWLAREIKKVSETNHFEFIGTVDTIAPWQVSGIAFEVNNLTQVSPGIEIGTLVRVEGIILEDGTWLASEIQRLDDEPGTLIFIGIVENNNPWVVNGIPLNVTDETVILGEITTGSLVRVYVRIQEDGTWQIMRIELIDIGPVSGCIEFTDIVIAFDDHEIVLQTGMTIPREVAEITGELKVGSQVLVQVCFSPEDEIIFASITVIDESIEPTPIPEPTPEPISGEKVTICHNPNNPQTISVDASAVDAHLAHGDYLGTCQDDGTNNNEDDKKDDKDDKKDDKGNGKP